nr:hybrid signal transduction histidine kinase M [Tanacetum cinerariifolium]
MDTIVLSWIFTTLSDDLQARLVVEHPRSTKATWDLLTEIVKDNKHSRLGSPCSSENVIKFALEGLPDKYDHICGIMHHRDTFPDLKTARSMLTTKEMRLKSKSQSLLVDSSSSSPMVLIDESGNTLRPLLLKLSLGDLAIILRKGRVGLVMGVNSFMINPFMLSLVIPVEVLNHRGIVRMNYW